MSKNGVPLENRGTGSRGRDARLAWIVLGLIVMPVASVLASERALGDRPNILFLVSDDLRPELGCYGNPIIQSPNIDRLARRGLVFNRAYCQQAVCSPSRTSVLTGMRPDTTKVWDLKTHFRKALPDVVTLPQLFRNHGYATLGLGKIYHSGLDDPPSWSMHMEVPRTNRTASTTPSPAAKTSNAGAGGPRLTKTDRGPAFAITDDPPNGGGEGSLADAAIAALRKRSSGSQPFFLGVGFHKPHLPFVVPRAYWDLYNPEEIPPAPNRFLPNDAPPYALVEKNELWNYSGVPDVASLPDGYARHLKHGYYAAVSYMDAQLGCVVDELDRLGLADNTIIVLWGDHGWKLGEHDRWCKHSNVEEDTRAPLIVSTPAMKAAGQHTDALVEFVDIYPTIAELAGLPLPDALEGKSFKSLLDDPRQTWKRAAFSQYPRTVNGRHLMGYSMRTDRYRFTRWVWRDDPTKVDAVELYDHQTDPQENTNIANHPAKRRLIEELTLQMPDTLPLLSTSTGVGEFAHPGVAHSAESIAFVRAKLEAKEQPWTNAWKTVKSSPEASLSWTPRPREHVERGAYNRPDIGSSDFSADAAAAYIHALCWALEGDHTHAEKSAEIVDAWSATLKSISNHDARLLVGMSGYKFTIAAELLKHTWNGWSADRQERFARMAREIWYPTIKDFYPSANGNWDASMLQTMMAMGVFLDDRAMFDRAKDYFLNGEGNGAIGNYFMQSGQCQESGRDQGHTQMGLDFLAATCETAWIQGVDLYGALDNRLLKGFEYTAKYNLGHDVPYEPCRSFQGRYYYKAISDNSRGRFRPMYERVFNHYHNRKGLEASFTWQAVERLRAGGSQSGRRRGQAGAALDTLMFASQP